VCVCNCVCILLLMPLWGHIFFTFRWTQLYVYSFIDAIVGTVSFPQLGGHNSVFVHLCVCVCVCINIVQKDPKSVI